ncbi:jg24563, partial [Pararge aegeria aegeria]
PLVLGPRELTGGPPDLVSAGGCGAGWGAAVAAHSVQVAVL